MRPLWLAFVLMGSTAALAQQSEAPAYSLAGTVRNALTGEPVSSAMVMSFCAGRSQSRVTDAAGVFRLTGFKEGGCTVSANRPGFSSSEQVTLTLGPSREDAVLRLMPLATVRGRITDGDGDPVPLVMVEVLCSQVRHGLRSLELAYTAYTDDRGQYTAFHLKPGLYAVRAIGRFGTAHTVRISGPGAATNEAFAPTYFGGGQSAATATLFPLAAGGEMNADIPLRLLPGRRILGTVTGLAPYRQTLIELLREEDNISGNRSTINVADGRFEVRDVVDGTYSLRVTQFDDSGHPMRAQQEVQVAGGDVKDVGLLMSPGVTVKGVTRNNRDGAVACTVRLTAASETLRVFRQLFQFEGRSAEGGAFEIPGVVPGRYTVDVSCLGGYVSAIRVGNDALGPQNELTVGTNAPQPFDIAVRTDTAAVSVTFGPAIGSKPVKALLVPRSDTGQPQEDDGIDAVVFRDIPPGEYRLHVWPAETEIEYVNPEVLRRLASTGLAVRVEAGGSAAVTVEHFSEPIQ